MAFVLLLNLDADDAGPRVRVQVLNGYGLTVSIEQLAGVQEGQACPLLQDALGGDFQGVGLLRQGGVDALPPIAMTEPN